MKNLGLKVETVYGLMGIKRGETAKGSLTTTLNFLKKP